MGCDLWVLAAGQPAPASRAWTKAEIAPRRLHPHSMDLAQRTTLAALSLGPRTTNSSSGLMRFPCPVPFQLPDARDCRADDRHRSAEPSDPDRPQGGQHYGVLQVAEQRQQNTSS